MICKKVGSLYVDVVKTIRLSNTGAYRNKDTIVITSEDELN